LVHRLTELRDEQHSAIVNRMNPRRFNDRIAATSRKVQAAEEMLIQHVISHRWFKAAHG